ncbi:catalase [Nakamurella panacisegetis]|uniref:Catalase n=1 Tax=Nakamurella panacisegetis TaxID=1090615 RepID=A0A1H0S6S8_9ACTN|nr:catalase [Nakamurella panacisegetis]SDP36928.1 catalase [Nakamurella panacisegetis]
MASKKPVSKKSDPKKPEPLAPGAPGVQPPSLAEPMTPVEPLPPKPDQQGPDPRTATGAPTSASGLDVAQQGAFLTTAHGARLADTDHSLKVGSRGPTLLQDHHLREKISHFDHERIPERVVHARGAAAHGVFVGNGAGESICRAGFLRAGVETPVFVRFSTVLGSRGSADLARDTRGFATRFYTDEGNYDLVGNNIPVFFIQDGIKFPDVVHAAKPHPDREIPQAQSAHDTFWDFVSLHTEAQAHTLWNMSDRGLPRSLRTMEGFGVHTFRLINADGQTCLVKFHWKPKQGVHSVTWEEAQLTNGNDPDFHRRDLADTIESGHYPEWDLGVQVMPDTEDEMFAGIDLLDPTKFVPEELAPVQVLGTMTLNRNPVNYFAETEQVAFNPANLAPGIDVTNDPLLQARLFSYLDTQITRLGGPNWNQIPINRAHAPINDMLRDGQHQDAVHGGVAPYRPHSLDGGCPFTAGPGDHPFIDIPAPVAAALKVRENPLTFEDHFTQATMFYRSLSPVEQDHVVAAYTFELSKCYEQTVRERQLLALANIDADLCARVADGLGLPAPAPSVPPTETDTTAAVSQICGTWPVAGRIVGVVIGPDSDAKDIQAVRAALTKAGVLPLVVGPRGGKIGVIAVQRTYANAASTEFDALIIVGATPPAPDAVPSLDAKSAAEGGPETTVDPRVLKMIGEAWRHAKAIGTAPGAGTSAPALLPAEAPGSATGTPAEVAAAVLQLLGAHRAWDRFPAVRTP